MARDKIIYVGKASKNMQRKDRTEPLWFFGILIFAFSLTALCQDVNELEKVANAILYLANKQTKGGFNPAKNDSKYRYELAQNFIDASNNFNIPWELGVTIGYFESVYRVEEKGTRDELGIMQVGKMGQRHCKEYCQDMKTSRQQIFCGYCWFKEGMGYCKDDDLKTGLTVYASGDCKSNHPRVIRAVNKRLKTIEKIKSL